MFEGPWFFWLLMGLFWGAIFCAPVKHISVGEYARRIMFGKKKDGDA